MHKQGLHITPRLIESLYTEAMLLADEARSYFEADRQAGRDDMAPPVAVAFSCESLKVTTRLMHCIAWILNQKAQYSGELSEAQVRNMDRRLGYAPASDTRYAQYFSDEAIGLIEASEDLFSRIGRLVEQMEQRNDDVPVVHNMIAQLQSQF